MFGESISYIRSTARQQNRLSTGLFGDHTVNEIREYSSKLKEASEHVDYMLTDLALATFYFNAGETMYNSIAAIIEETKKHARLPMDSLISPAIAKVETFKQVIFNYLYVSLQLAKHGIIHNDPHLNNILISPNRAKTKTDYQMPNGTIIAIGYCPIAITIIDFDKSILSHQHGNDFTETVRTINEEMGIVFEDMKTNIVDDYSQVFNCYVMYDVIKFCLVMARVLEDMRMAVIDYLDKPTLDSSHGFLQRTIKLATSILVKIYEVDPKLPFDPENLYGSAQYLITELFHDYIKTNKTRSSKTPLATAKIASSPNTSGDRPEFVSSRKKYADALKSRFISEYISMNLS